MGESVRFSGGIDACLAGKTPRNKDMYPRAPRGGSYVEGAHQYLIFVGKLIEIANKHGKHMSHFEAMRALRRTAETLAGGGYELGDALERYAEKVVLTSHTALKESVRFVCDDSIPVEGKKF